MGLIGLVVSPSWLQIPHLGPLCCWGRCPLGFVPTSVHSAARLGAGARTSISGVASEGPGESVSTGITETCSTLLLRRARCKEQLKTGPISGHSHSSRKGLGVRQSGRKKFQQSVSGKFSVVAAPDMRQLSWAKTGTDGSTSSRMVLSLRSITLRSLEGHPSKGHHIESPSLSPCVFDDQSLFILNCQCRGLQSKATARETPTHFPTSERLPSHMAADPTKVGPRENSIKAAPCGTRASPAQP